MCHEFVIIVYFCWVLFTQVCWPKWKTRAWLPCQLHHVSLCFLLSCYRFFTPSLFYLCTVDVSLTDCYDTKILNIQRYFITRSKSRGLSTKYVNTVDVDFSSISSDRPFCTTVLFSLCYWIKYTLCLCFSQSSIRTPWRAFQLVW